LTENLHFKGLMEGRLLDSSVAYSPARRPPDGPGVDNM